MLRTHDVHLVDDQPEAVPDVNHGGIHTLSRSGSEYQPNRIFFPPNGERMNFRRRCILCNRRTHLQHVGAEYPAAICEVIGVVLHEGCPTLETMTHKFKSPHQGGAL